MVLALEFEKLQIRQERNNRGGGASVEHVWSGSISCGHTMVVTGWITISNTSKERARVTDDSVKSQEHAFHVKENKRVTRSEWAGCLEGRIWEATGQESENQS